MQTYEVLVRGLKNRRADGPGACAADAEWAACGSEDASTLHTTSGYSVIEDGVTLSQFDYERPASTDRSHLRLLASWLASHVRLVHPR